MKRIFFTLLILIGVGSFFPDARAQFELSCARPQTDYQTFTTNRTMVGFPGNDITKVPRTRWLQSVTYDYWYIDLAGPLIAYDAGEANTTTQTWNPDSADPNTPCVSGGMSVFFPALYDTNVCESTWTCTYDPGCTIPNLGGPIYVNLTSYWTLYASVTNYPPTDTSVRSANSLDYTDATGQEWAEGGEYRVDLSNEYKPKTMLGSLRGDTKTLEPTVGNSWSSTPVSGSLALSYSNDGDGGVSLTSATDTGLAYRFKLTTDLKAPYRVSWDEVYEFGTNAPPILIHRTELLMGNGDYMTGAVHYAYAMLTDVLYDYSSVKIANQTYGLAHGQDCLCDPKSRPGGGGQPNFALPRGPYKAESMGRDNYGLPAGNLIYHPTLWASGPSLVSPTNLFFEAPDFPTRSLQISSSSILNPKTYLTEAFVVKSNDFQYEVRFYTLTNGTRLTGTPYLTWTLLNPDGASASNRVYLIESRPGSVLTNMFGFDWGTQNWTSSIANGARIERYLPHATINTTLGAADAVGETYEIYDNTGTNLLWKRVRATAAIDGQWVISSDQIGNDKPTTYSYWEDGQIEQITYPDGSWQLFNGYVEAGPTEIYNSYQNGSASLDWTANRFSSVEYGAWESEPADVSTVCPMSPRQEIDYFLGVPIGATFRFYRPNVREVRREPFSISDYASSDGLVTILTNYSSGPYAHEPYTIRNENGTYDAFFYSTNSTSKTITRLSGEYTGAAVTNITKGIKTVTVVGIAGEIYSEARYDIASGLQVYGKTMSAMDDFRRPVRIDYLDGTFEGFGYGCCHLDTKTNRDGSIVSYTYDALGNRIAATSENISYLYSVDAAGRLLGVTRQGTNGNQIPIVSLGYNLEGRVVSETDALNNAVTLAQSTNGSGETLRTVTFPNLATWIERVAKDGSLQEISGTAAHPLRFYYGVESTGDSDTNGPASAFYTKVARVSDSNTETEWTKTYTDLAGRDYKRVFAAASGSPTEQVWFNNKNQLARGDDADGVSRLYLYDGIGDLQYAVADLDGNHAIDWGGADEVTQFVNAVFNTNGVYVRQSRFVWPAAGANSSNLVSFTEMTADRLTNRFVLWNSSAGTGVTNSLVRVIGANGSQQTKVARPWGEYALGDFLRGQLLSLTRKDTNNAQLEQRTFGYDAHGRLKTDTGARDGATSYQYDDADRVMQVTQPAAGDGSDARFSVFTYDNMGQVRLEQLPDFSLVTNVYTARGELQQTSGSQTYPVGYGYDTQGRLTRMTNWQNFASGSGAEITKWNYDDYRGFLMGKLYDDNKGPDYTYTAAGRVATLAWERGTTASYAYDGAGRLFTSIYNDSGFTPSRTNRYDRRGRLAGIQQDSILTTNRYNDFGRKLSESYAGGALDGLSVTNDYDAVQRRSQVIAANYSGSKNAYTYDTAGRLSTVGDGTYSVTYSYLANSRLASQLTFKQSTTTKLTTVRQYDFLDRLTSTYSTPSGANMGPVAFNYGYNALNQRTRADLEDGNYWRYDYDAKGQLANGKKFWNDNTPVEGQQWEYTFDDIGNRTALKEGGNAAGASLRSSTWSRNTLNQITSRTVPSYVDVIGTTTNSGTVTINSSAADYRRGPYFRKELAVDNTTTTNAVLLSVSVSSSPDTAGGNLLIPPSTQNIAYDADGNINHDNVWKYIFNGRNQLVEVQPLTNNPTTTKRRDTFAYDYAGRRTLKTVATLSGSTWTLTVSNRFLYDGWNLIAELNATNNTPIRTYIWGKDLSGSLQGAGGVGGLIAINDAIQGMHFVVHDGSGNIVALVSAANGAITARYEYDAFNRLIRMSGPMAAVNPFHAADKYEDLEVGLVYYGHRYYHTGLQRWLTRDPIEEYGGLNIYAYCNNDAQNYVDPIGLAWYDWLNPLSYSSAYANMVGKWQAQEMLEQHGYTSEQNLLMASQNPTSTATANDNTAVVAVAGVAAAAAAVYLDAATSVTPEAHAGEIMSHFGEICARKGEAKAAKAAEEAAEKLGRQAAKTTATFGSAASMDYRATFFAAHPELEGKVIVHHAVEQQVLDKFPGVVTESEIHSLENLRGIPNELNSQVHLSEIRVEWNQFYKPFKESGTSPTKAQLLQKAAEIDQKFGLRFEPPVGGVQ